MNIVKKLLLCTTVTISLFSATSALALITPESGWWWNPDESGRGFSIEIQDSTVFMATYTYEDIERDGVRRPVWFFSSGALTGDSNYEGSLLLLEDGQCFGCDYAAPATSATEGHDVSITFLTATTAEITIDGDTTSIERFQFAPQFVNKVDAIMGEWSLVFNAPAGFDGDAITGDVLILNEEDSTIASIDVRGCRASSIYSNGCTASNSIAAASYLDEIDEYLILYSYNETTWRAVIATTLGTNSFAGLIDQYDKNTGELDVSRAVSLRAYRSASKTFVQTGSGPAKPAIATAEGRNKIISSISKAQMKGETAALSAHEKMKIRSRAITEMIAELKSKSK